MLSILLVLCLSHACVHVQVWSVCPIDSSSSLREENAIVCCSMLGGLTASKCLCDEVGHAEPDLLHFITSWQQVCSTESLSKVCVSSSDTILKHLTMHRIPLHPPGPPPLLPPQPPVPPPKMNPYSYCGCCYSFWALYFLPGEVCACCQAALPTRSALQQSLWS